MLKILFPFLECASIILAGLKNSQGTGCTATKGKTYAVSKELIQRFEEKMVLLYVKN